MNRKTQRTAKYLIHLLKAVLDGRQPMELPEDVDFESLYQLAAFHHVQCMAYYGIERLKIQPEAEKNRKWRSERDQNIVKSMMQLTERDRMIRALTGAGIDVLPLKGCYLKQMYPQEDYRQMADLDVLIDAKKADKARTIMENLGYETKMFDATNHDIYEKPPYMGVELHRSMFSRDYRKYYVYYREIWKKAQPDPDSPHSFHLSWDDYYIFLLVHFAKHYDNGGSGIRSIMDIYVFLKQHRKHLHQEYLNRELASLGLNPFRKTAEKLAENWFGEKKRAAAEEGIRRDLEEMESYVITSGVYGTRERGIHNRIRKMEQETHSVLGGRVLYLIKRAFLDYKMMCSEYPILRRIPVLLPFCWILRWIYAWQHKKDKVREEFRGIFARYGKDKER